MSQETRKKYLSELTRRIVQAGKLGLLSKQSFVPSVQVVSGPRAAVALVSAGSLTGEVLKALSKDNAALLRQLLPFDFDDKTLSVSLSKWYVRLEAGWPLDLQERVVKLTSVCQKPLGNGHWVVGLNEYGATVVGALDDSTPHWLVGGTSGSGKSVALHNLIYQLVRADDCILVLIDGKEGESLKRLEALPCVLGQCATNVDAARGALSYVLSKMQERYELVSRESVSESTAKRLVVVFDEFQEFASDKFVAEAIRKIASLGRAASVHLVLATQHPVNSVMGDPQTKRNLRGRLALQVTDFAASQVVVGSEHPRADKLTGAGDCYCQGERVQGTLVTGTDMQALYVERQPFLHCTRGEQCSAVCSGW